MEEMINSFNVDIGVFIHQLRLFTDRNNVQIGGKTKKLLLDAVSNIYELVAKATEIRVSNEADADFLQNFDQRHFELRQNIMCRLCIEPVSVSREDFQAHLGKSSHLSRMQRITPSTSTPPPPTKTPKFNWPQTVNNNWQHGSNNSLAANVEKETEKENASVPSSESNKPTARIASDVVEKVQRKKIRSAYLMNDSQQGHSLYLKFSDRAEKHCEMELSFNGDDNLEAAFNRIVEVMDLEKSKSKFFNSEGQHIANLNITITEFLANNSLNISYEELDGTRLHFQRTNGRGTITDVVDLLINESTTIGDICEMCENQVLFLRLKDGVIRSIVSSDTLAINLLNDGFDYRLDQYLSALRIGQDLFFVCVRFVGDSPEPRLRTPLLVEVENGASLQTLSLRVCHVLNDYLNIRYNFDFNVVEDCVERTAVGIVRLVKPNDPEVIPVIELNMHVDKSKRKNRANYRYRDIML